jgi:multiple sugar transport system substrate-binding protein
MNARPYWPLAFLLLISLVGCSSLPFGLGNILSSGTQTPETIPAHTVISTSETQATQIPAVTQGHPVVTQPGGVPSLRVWLPPQFDPDGSSLASDLLRARLDEFEAKYSTIRLDVRVKALDGPGGMLDSLVAASAAAPQALPDLVLIPRVLLESAAVKGLLYPYDGLTNIMDDQSWFEYAIQLAHLKDSTYGIPFAGDVMVLARAITETVAAPLSLQDTLFQKNVLLYPAGDPQALFTMCMYLAEGGKLQNDQGRPALDELPLANILNYDQQASLEGVMPYTLTQFTDDSQVWEALLSGQYPLAVTWASTFLADPRIGQANLALAPLPTPDGTPFTLANGWSWALAGQDPAARHLSVTLAEFLVDKEFMAEWTQAAGYLPPRVDALQAWPESPWQKVIEQVSFSAWLAPSPDLTATVGPVLQQALVDVLAGRRDAQSAAQAAVDQINQP